MKKTIDICSDLITPRIALSLIPAFKAAYGMASFAADSVDFLGGALREQIMPHLKNWAVEYELHRRSVEGIIPFDCSTVPNVRKNHRHIELRKNGFVLTVSQTHTLYSLPRECVFRNDRNLDGQIALGGFETDSGEAGGEIYAILTHGQGSSAPAYIVCGIPNPNMTAWAQHVNLYNVIRDITLLDETPVTDEIKLDFRDKVREQAKKIL